MVRNVIFTGIFYIVYVHNTLPIQLHWYLFNRYSIEIYMISMTLFFETCEFFHLINDYRDDLLFRFGELRKHVEEIPSPGIHLQIRLGDLIQRFEIQIKSKSVACKLCLNPNQIKSTARFVLIDLI
jgi:hypothetical protein